MAAPRRAGGPGLLALMVWTNARRSPGPMPPGTSCCWRTRTVPVGTTTRSTRDSRSWIGLRRSVGRAVPRPGGDRGAPRPSAAARGHGLAADRLVVCGARAAAAVPRGRAEPGRRRRDGRRTGRRPADDRRARRRPGRLPPVPCRAGRPAPSARPIRRGDGRVPASPRPRQPEGTRVPRAPHLEMAVSGLD